MTICTGIISSWTNSEMSRYQHVLMHLVSLHFLKYVAQHVVAAFSNSYQLLHRLLHCNHARVHADHVGGWGHYRRIFRVAADRHRYREDCGRPHGWLHQLPGPHPVRLLRASLSSDRPSL